MEIVDRKIRDLVTENYVYASVLHHLGIQFYNYSEDTLSQVCRRKGLDVNQVIKSLEAIQNQKNEAPPLRNYPIDLVLQYLIHTHFIFVSQKLPYMARLIEDLDAKQIGSNILVKDLQILFPLFVEDFIKHIHEEEDILFKYILQLHQASLGVYKPGSLYRSMEKYSIQYFVLDHHTHDDEMRGIRELTNNYQLHRSSSLHLRVLYSELKALEQELITHACIEDEVLFMKALRLENLVREMLKQKSKWN